MKTFIYFVGDRTWDDTEAFGEAWQQAKKYASELHTAIYREVRKVGKPTRHEVFYKGGVFNSVEFIREDNIMIW